MNDLVAGQAAIVVEGLSVGHAQNDLAVTGLTVLLFDESVPASGSLCGTATSTRQADALRPEHVVNAVDAFLLTGGSAYGLDSTGGVLSWLEARGRGLPTRYGPVPVCPTAALYDLSLGSFDIRPDAEMAKRACESADSNVVAMGSVGAGRGATVGKLFGVDQTMKGGFGTASKKVSGVNVQAFAACNAFGDVVDPATGRILAGARKAPDSMELVDSAKAIADGRIPSSFIRPKSENTVLVAICTDGKFTKAECAEIARSGAIGMSDALSPARSPFDGDVVFCAATGKRSGKLDEVAKAAAELAAEAIVQAVLHAEGHAPAVSYRDLRRVLKSSNEK